MSEPVAQNQPRRTRIFQALGIISFIVVLVMTWLILTTHYTDFWYKNALSFFVIGIAGIAVLGLSLPMLYKSEPHPEPSIWRLFEKIALTLGFVFILIALLFSGFSGTMDKTTMPMSWGFSIVATILTIIGFVSYTARTGRYKR